MNYRYEDKPACYYFVNQYAEYVICLDNGDTMTFGTRDEFEKKVESLHKMGVMVFSNGAFKLGLEQGFISKSLDS